VSDDELIGGKIKMIDFEEVEMMMQEGAFRDIAPPEVIAAFWEALEIENRRHAQSVAALFDDLLSYKGAAS